MPTQPAAAPAPVAVAAAPAEVSPIKKQEPRKSCSNEITDVRIVIGYKAPDGTRHEAIQMIDPNEYIIDGYTLTIDKKTQKCKDEEGNFLGFEPTGEQLLSFKAKFRTR